MRVFRGPQALKEARKAVGTRCLRAPHHTSSKESIIGRLFVSRLSGTLTYTPGEVGLAERGFLLLDDLPEWSLKTIEAIAYVHKRNRIELHFTEEGGKRMRYLSVPCRFDIVATAHDCPCGMLHDKSLHCACSKEAKRAFESRIARFKAIIEGEA